MLTAEVWPRATAASQAYDFVSPCGVRGEVQIVALARKVNKGGKVKRRGRWWHGASPETREMSVIFAPKRTQKPCETVAHQLQL